MNEIDKRHFCISVANHVVEINTLYANTYNMCDGYLCDGIPDFCVSINEDDILFEKQEAKKQRGPSNDDYLETLAVYRKIAENVLDYDTFLMHGAVIAHNNQAYLFTAKSGTGKTTHIRKWINSLPDAYVVNGDKPLIRITKTEAIAYGTPWCGKEKLGKNCMVPLKAIVLMERGENNEIQTITFGQAITGLLQQTYMPTDADKMRKTLTLLSKLQGKVKIYKYVFNNMKDDAFTVSYGTIADN